MEDLQWPGGPQAVTRPKRYRIPIAILPDPKSIRAPMEPVYAHRRPGRPALCSEDVLQRFLLALRAGNFRYVAAQYAGLNPESVKQWYFRGKGHRPDRPATPEYVRFVRMVDEAEAAAEVLVVGNLVKRSATNTRAAEFYLTNKAPSRWHRLPEENEEPPAQQPVVIDQSTHQNLIILDPREHPELIEAYLKAQGTTTKEIDGARIRGLISEG